MMQDVMSVVLAVVLALVLRFFVLSFTLVKGRSMLPTLENRDFLFVWRLSCRLRGPKRQDVVICHYPGRYWKGLKLVPINFVKRVVGLPGDTVEISEGRLLINGRPLHEPYLDPKRTRFFRDRAPVILGQDEYFLLGDNRDNSNDSRAVGPIRKSAIMGRAVCILWPFRRLGRIR